MAEFKLCYINDLPNFLNKESNTEKDQLHTPKVDIIINNLWFADDLTILSWSKYELQKKISNYCEKWGLELNLDKTKVMINDIKQTKVYRKKHKFYFQGKEIEIVEQYTYLGFTFIRSDKNRKASRIFWKTRQKHGLQFKDFYLNRKKTLDTYLHFTWKNCFVNCTLRL